MQGLWQFLKESFGILTCLVIVSVAGWIASQPREVVLPSTPLKSQHISEGMEDASPADTKVRAEESSPAAVHSSGASLQATARGAPVSPYLAADVASALPPTVREFHQLNAKALRTSNEQSRLSELLDSNQLYDDIKNILLGRSDGPVAVVEKAHMAATAIVEKALSFEGLQSRTLALQLIDDVVFNHSLSSLSALSAEKINPDSIVVQDRAELIHYALSSHGELRDSYLQRSQHDPITRQLVNNAIQYAQSLQATANYISRQKNFTGGQ